MKDPNHPYEMSRLEFVRHSLNYAAHKGGITFENAEKLGDWVALQQRNVAILFYASALSFGLFVSAVIYLVVR